MWGAVPMSLVVVSAAEGAEVVEVVGSGAIDDIVQKPGHLTLDQGLWKRVHGWDSKAKPSPPR